MGSQSEESLWGLLLVRGIIATLFGIAAVFWPGITLVTLIYLFSAFILANGIVNLIAGLVTGDRTITSRLLVSLISIVEIGVGVYLLRHPLITAKSLILIIGFTLVASGVIDIVQGLFGEGSATQKMFTIIVGILAGLAGIVMLFQPAASGVAFVWILGLYAIITGPMLFAMAFELKSANQSGK